MKAVLALIVIYVGTFLVAIQGASNSPVEASEQSRTKATASIDPVKEADIRALLELVGAKDAVEDAASLATEQYRQKVIEASGNDDRAKAFVHDYLADFQKKFDANAFDNELVGIYDKHFTDEEIKGLLEFYGSPLGQKVAAELPKINREVQFATRDASTQAARQAWQDLRAEYPNVREGSRRRRLNATAEPPRPATGAPISADASQP
ncbi:MAG TPA: DUF2059 domain-containing protein [Candidatus Acidoferrum sp.]|nr:DUF2059 domain-containing protein [Candidatus Acidoferrum sp.]